MINNNKKPLKWVIMIYACANDKNSEAGMTNFFRDLNKVGKKIDNKPGQPKIKILLHAYRDWDKSKRKRYYAKRFEIKNNFLENGKDEKDVIYTRLYTNMGDPNALSDFIAWCKKKYKADHYLLLLWGHGAQYGMFTGELAGAAKVLKKPWRFNMFSDGKKIPYINALKPVKKTIAEQYSEIQQVRIEFKTKNSNGLVDTDKIERKVINNGAEKIGPNKKVLPPTVIYYFDVEKNNRSVKLSQLIPRKPIDDSLTIEEVCKSLWDTGHYIKSSGPIEIIMIFGCAMQTFELAYELSKCGKLGCKYLIASEELIYWEGYNYRKSFLRLLENPDMDSEDLCKHIINDTRLKRPRKKNRNDGHYDKPSWAISCVNIQKSPEVAKMLDSISAAIDELSEYPIKGVNRNLKMNWVTEFRRNLLIARVHCCHFGEDAFVESYIDAAWFFKVFKELIKRDLYLKSGIRLGPRSERTYKKYLRLIKELEDLIKILTKDFIIEKWIGPKRSEQGYLSKIIYRKKGFKFRLQQSWGGHGIAIYFPLSRKVLKSDKNQEKLFFQKDTDYNLEFMRNKWQSMNKEYMKRNEKISSNFYNKNRVYKKGIYTKPRIADKGQTMKWAIEST